MNEGATKMISTPFWKVIFGRRETLHMPSKKHECLPNTLACALYTPAIFIFKFYFKFIKLLNYPLINLIITKKFTLVV
jgi:hypothetical protein